MSHEKILADLAEQRGFTAEDIVGRGRSLKLSAVRRTVARRLRADGLSLPEIGYVMERHHTTILSLLLEGERLQKRTRQKKAWRLAKSRAERSARLAKAQKRSTERAA